MKPDQQHRIPQAPAADLATRRNFLRWLGTGMATAVVAGLSGCAFKRCTLAKDMPMPDVVAHLNHNIDQLDSFKCDKVGIKVHGGPMLMPSVNGMLAVQRPLNFRLQATMPVGGSCLADLGSNEERIWFWVKDESMPDILTARHDCLGRAQSVLPMPIDPTWLLDTFGVVPLDSNEIEFEKHPTDPQRIFLRRQRTAPDGTTVELVSTVDTCKGVIVDHSVTDQSGNMIALARLSEHHADGKTGIIIPHTVALSWPATQMGMTLRMGAVIVNPEHTPAGQFQLPEIANCGVQELGGEELPYAEMPELPTMPAEAPPRRRAESTGRSKV